MTGPPTAAPGSQNPYPKTSRDDVLRERVPDGFVRLVRVTGLEAAGRLAVTLDTLRVERQQNFSQILLDAEARLKTKLEAAL